METKTNLFSSIKKEHKIKITLNKEIGLLSLIGLLNSPQTTAQLKEYGFEIKEIEEIK